MASVKERIVANSARDLKTGCWNWTKFIEKNGYAKTKHNGKSMWAHRVSYEQFVGQIPDGLDVCHKCDNRRCVNPNHLFAGTRLENMRDAEAKNRIAKGKSLPHAKLSDLDKEQIISMAIAGIKYEKIGNKFGICKQSAGRIAIQQGVRRNGISQ